MDFDGMTNESDEGMVLHLQYLKCVRRRATRNRQTMLRCALIKCKHSTNGNSNQQASYAEDILKWCYHV